MSAESGKVSNHKLSFSKPDLKENEPERLAKEHEASWLEFNEWITEMLKRSDGTVQAAASTASPDPVGCSPTRAEGGACGA